MQKSIEDHADRMIQAARSRGRKRSNGCDGLSASSILKKKCITCKTDSNLFLPGKTFMNGDWMTPYDRQITDLLMTSDELQKSKISKKSISSFCLPQDMQKEVRFLKLSSIICIISF